MSFSVHGKNAIVTGASSGIGLAFGKLLVSRGARVIVADIQETPALQELQRSAGSGLVLFHRTDVARWGDLIALFAFARSRWSGIDLLCNGAGIFEPVWSSFWKDTESESYASLDINTQGLIKATRLAIKDQLTRSKGRNAGETIGVVLNISSAAAQLPLFNQPLYCTSKAAVSAFTRSLGPLHAEFGVKVVAVAPGMVMTPLWSENPDKMKALSEEDELATPEDIAETMLAVVEGTEFPGGTVVERLKGAVRKVAVDSPLPSGPGSTMSKMDLIYEDTIALLDKERTRVASDGHGE